MSLSLYMGPGLSLSSSKSLSHPIRLGMSHNLRVSRRLLLRGALQLAMALRLPIEATDATLNSRLALPVSWRSDRSGSSLYCITIVLCLMHVLMTSCTTLCTTLCSTVHGSVCIVFLNCSMRNIRTGIMLITGHNFM